MKLRIAIAGTRGIPNHYGGYEQAVTFLAEGLVKKGHHVTVYNSANHPYQLRTWQGVDIVHCKDPEHKIGTAGQFIYDLNCIRDCARKEFDILLLMGYTSSSVWGRWYPAKPIIISNMDGLEWKRSKYSKPVRYFLRYAEKLAIRFSDYHIADSTAIKTYLDEKYNIDSIYIPYGATTTHSPINHPDNDWEKETNYFLLIARIEPENNIEIILDGFVLSGSDKKFMVIGNTATRFGKKIRKKFQHCTNIMFKESVFDQSLLHYIRSKAALYFHGHSVGGTNPSLLEAMAARTTIVAHNNPFNQAILGNDSYYFSNAADIKGVIEGLNLIHRNEQMIEQNFQKIKKLYTWESIINQYEACMLNCYHKGKK
jgi:glycosyltransferase involved in cell wall biosynthesis